jgi:glycosyltransferase involved in cell wall biosynthesis
MKKKPHIVILAKGTSSWIGGREYTRNLLEAIFAFRMGTGREFDVSLMVSSEAEAGEFSVSSSELKTVAVADYRGPRFALFRRLRWKAMRVAGLSFNPRLQERLLLMGATFVYPCMTAPSGLQPFASAEWIPDFQFKHYPQGSNPLEVSARRRQFRHIAENAQRIVLSSEMAEADCVELYPQTRERTSILRFRVSSRLINIRSDPVTTIVKYHLPRRYFIVSNILAPTKNHEVVLDALLALRTDGIYIPVVFTGDIHDYRNPGFYNRFLAGIQERNLHKMVRVLGLIPRTDQMDLLRGSVASVQPSLFEGWHTGVEEARLLGKPIILSNIPVHREQDPPKGVFFDPASSADLARAMRHLWETEAIGYIKSSEMHAVRSYERLRIEFGREFAALAGIDGASIASTPAPRSCKSPFNRGQSVCSAEPVISSNEKG